MKLLTSLLIASLLTTAAFSQTDSVALIAYWMKGESQTFKVNKKSVEMKNGNVVKQDSSSYSIRITVMDSTESSYQLDWQGASPLTTTQSIEVEMEQIMRDKYSDFSIKYSTDENGSFTEITNQQEIVNMMNDMLDNMKFPSKDSTAASIVKQTVASLRQILNSKEGLEGILLKEIKLFHWPFGLWYHQGDTIHYEEDLPGLLGGVSVGGSGQVYLDGIDTNSTLCRIRNDVVLDSATLKSAITTFLENILNNSTFKSASEKDAKLLEMKKAFGDLTMNMTRETVFDVDYETGWPVSILFTQTISAGAAQEGESIKTETVSITVL